MKLIEKHDLTGWEIIWECKPDGIHNPTSNIAGSELPQFISWGDMIKNISIRKDDSWKRILTS